MVAQGSHGQTAGSVHTPELAHSAGVLGHLQFSVADQLVRGVVAVTDPVAARSEGDALVRVGAPELLDGQVSSILGGGSSQLNSSLPSKHSIWPSHTWFHLRQRESSWHMKPLHWSMMVQNLPSSAPSAQSYLSSHSWYSFTHDPSVHMNSSVSQSGAAGTFLGSQKSASSSPWK